VRDAGSGCDTLPRSGRLRELPQTVHPAPDACAHRVGSAIPSEGNGHSRRRLPCMWPRRHVTAQQPIAGGEAWAAFPHHKLAPTVSCRLPRKAECVAVLDLIRDSHMPKFLNSHASRNLLFVVILASVASGLGYLATRHHVQRDVTYNTINSLEPASIEVLRQLQGPVEITVYATEQDARLGDIRKILRDFLSLYQRYKPDIHLVFVDPGKEPERARAAQIRFNGEMVIEYAGRSEHLTKINEPIVTATLLRLAHTRNQTVMYLDGHGERKLDGIANFDLGSLFGAKLKQSGYHLASLNLALAQQVPGNVSVLVITQPQLELMPGEVDKLLRYIDRGGNLLWLVDAEPLHGLERLAEKLDLQLPPGIVIDPAAFEMNAPATWSLGANYPPHAITHNFNLTTAFPSARPLLWNDNPDWQHNVLVEVAPRGWVSRKPLPRQGGVDPSGAGGAAEQLHPQTVGNASNVSQLHFDKRHDTPGPVVIAMALQRKINNREQRIVVVGDGAFLANSFAGNGGNVDLGVNMVNWLAGEEHLIVQHLRPAKDSKLELSAMQLRLISIGFLLGLPLLLAGTGGYIWWKRRRA
jgi:gliding motility-associatede transport system auxiliary component